MPTQLPVQKGISSYAVGRIPDKWDASWFKYFIDNFLSGADIRNVTTGTGITINGNVSGNGTNNTSSGVTITQTPIPNNEVLGNVSGVTAVAVGLTTTQLTTLVNLFTPTLSGAVPLSGGGTTNFLRADGTWAPPATAIAANPTALVGPITVNGVATTFMRSDAAPAIDLTATFAWTGTHTFLTHPIGITSGGTGTATPALAAGTGISITGTWPNNTITSTVSSPIGANPTASVGLSAVNGVAATFLRSDGAPALSQAISPVWSSNHIFTPSSGVAVTINGTIGNSGLTVNGAASSATILAVAATTGASFGDIIVQRSTSTANSFAQGPNLKLEDTSGSDFSATWQASGSQVELWAGLGASQNQILKVTAANGITINVPTGTANSLTINGIANAYSTLCKGSSTAGQSFGLLVRGGTNASDNAVLIQNQSGGASFMAIAGDGTVTVSPSGANGSLITTNAALTNNAGATSPTLGATGPAGATTPTKWIKINDNGTIRSIPAW